MYVLYPILNKWNIDFKIICHNSFDFFLHSIQIFYRKGDD